MAFSTGWLSGQKMTLKTYPDRSDATVDIDFDFWVWDDIVDNINGAVYLLSEARKGSYGGVIDLSYSDVELEEDTLGLLSSYLTSQTKTWMVTAAGFYKVIEDGPIFLDTMIGARYWTLEPTFELTVGALPEDKINYHQTWIDPVVGIKGMLPLGTSIFFSSCATSIGDFGAGSDFMWDTTEQKVSQPL